MRSRALMLGLGVVLVMVVSLSSAACSSSGSSPTPSAPPAPSASPTPGVGGAPSKAEITAAVKRFIKQRHIPSPWTISVLGVEQDASGRWRASANLMPPPTMSYWPGIMVIVKNPGGWHFVSLKADMPEPTLPLPWSPAAMAQPL